MEIEIIENIVSELPLYEIKGNSLIHILNTEKRRISERTVEIDANEKTEPTMMQDSFQEGGINEVYGEYKIQKRNPKLREEAIRQHGYNCFVCDFNFEDIYGNFGAGYIEVHHLELLSSIKSERTLTAKDVAVVCANCHRVLHRNGKEPMRLEELKGKVEEIRSLRKK
jgi:predicted HNH restriction endonuclease